MSEFVDLEHNKDYNLAYKETTPDIMKAFVAFDAAVFQPEGREIPLKYRELMALAVGITTQCPWCIDSHSKNAVKAGASEAEIAEAAWVATAIRAGGGFTHGRAALQQSGLHEDHKH